MSLNNDVQTLSFIQKREFFAAGQGRRATQASGRRIENAGGGVSTASGIILSDEVIRHGAAVNPEEDFAVHVESVKQVFKELAVQMELMVAS